MTEKNEEARSWSLNSPLQTEVVLEIVQVNQELSSKENKRCDLEDF